MDLAHDLGRVRIARCELGRRERAAIMYGSCRKMDPLDDRGEASTSVNVERRARNVMPRRHDAASSRQKKMRAKCFRGVVQQDHRKVVAGVMLPKVRRRSSKEDRASRDAADRFLPSADGRITDRDEQERALKESSFECDGRLRSSLRGSRSQVGSEPPRKGGAPRKVGGDGSSKEDRSRAERKAVFVRGPQPGSNAGDLRRKIDERAS
jgi:hypothetical protein